jgi:hypothetical protein
MAVLSVILGDQFGQNLGPPSGTSGALAAISLTSLLVIASANE